MGQIVKYTFIAVGAYLVLVYATGAGRLLQTGGNVYVAGVRTLQGR